MEATERLLLPMLIAGQSQKEVIHNEALQLLDVLVAAAVEEPPRDDPPVPAVTGTCFLVGASPTAEWSQFAGHLAAFTAGGWRFVPPRQGLNVFVKSTGTTAHYGAAGWEIGVLAASRLLIDGAQVLGPQQGPIAGPTGGSAVDAEARQTLDEILSALRGHGLIAT
jgi:hypothetical protein